MEYLTNKIHDAVNEKKIQIVEGIHTILFTNSKATVLLNQGFKSSEFWRKKNNLLNNKWNIPMNKCSGFRRNR